VEAARQALQKPRVPVTATVPRTGELMQCLKNAEVTPVLVADGSSNLTKSGEDARRQAKADAAFLGLRAHRSLPVPTDDAAYHTKLSRPTVGAAKRIPEDLMADVMRRTSP